MLRCLNYKKLNVEWFTENQAFSPSIWFGFSPLYREQVVSLSQSSCVAGRAYWWKSGRGVAKSHDSENTWSSINRSILSALDSSNGFMKRISPGELWCRRIFKSVRSGPTAGGRTRAAGPEDPWGGKGNRADAQRHQCSAILWRLCAVALLRTTYYCCSTIHQLILALLLQIILFYF